MGILEEIKSIASMRRPARLQPKPGVRKAALKEIVVFLGTLFFVLGGGIISTIVLFSFSIHTVFPELSQRGLKAIEIFTIIPLLFVFLLFGMLVGSVVWLFVATPWFSRDELKKYFTKPYVPFISPVLSWLFEKAYRR